MKGHMQDGKFHPHTTHKKVSRKKREPFHVTKDGVKITQRELIQMQRADVGRRKKDDSFEIGDNVSYWGGIGKITYIRYDSKTQKPLQYKINGKFVQPDSIKTRKARDMITMPSHLHDIADERATRLTNNASRDQLIGLYQDFIFKEPPRSISKNELREEVWTAISVESFVELENADNKKEQDELIGEW